MPVFYKVVMTSFSAVSAIATEYPVPILSRIGLIDEKECCILQMFLPTWYGKSIFYKVLLIENSVKTTRAA